jgi:hypothetical protein
MSNGDYYSESYTQQAIPIVTTLVTNSHQLVTNSHQPSNDECVVTNSNPYLVGNSEVVTRLVTTHSSNRGEGVESEFLEVVTNLVAPGKAPELLESLSKSRAIAFICFSC